MALQLSHRAGALCPLYDIERYHGQLLWETCGMLESGAEAHSCPPSQWIGSLYGLL